MSEYYDDDTLEDEQDPIEAYCVRCRQSVEMELPEAVWTRKGLPATRGICPDCGGTVFRMGASHLHEGRERPKAIDVTKEDNKRNRPKLPQDTVYLAYAEADEALAQQIADDLEKSGIKTWMHDQTSDGEKVAWAGGIHPALKACKRMIYLLSPASGDDAGVKASWQFFKDQRKPIIIAQLDTVEPPDEIRRSPRFDFTKDYRKTFREMMHALG